MSVDFTKIDKNGKVVIDQFDDYQMRMDGIKAFFDVFGFEMISGTKTGIDLIFKNNPISGAEGEDGQWDCDYETHNKSDTFNLGRQTVNVACRKFHFHNLQELSNKKKAVKWWGKFDEGWKNNWHYRENVQRNQMYFIPPEVMLDESKRILVKDRIVSNSTELEDFICIPIEYTYRVNLQPNGIWKWNGDYCGISLEEFEKLKRAAELKRLQELHKNRKKDV
jgi:hypothetical protein